jgi:tRNA-2-methylthio-N6-dimethylallyladenosine synthase
MMNRTYTQNEFSKLVDKIRNRIPGVILTTDIIVGFPTETEQDFEDTLLLMKEVEFDSAFMFIYSERKMTIAERRFKDDVTEDIKSERMTRLVELQRAISFRKNQGEIGNIHQILVEGAAKKPDQMYGRNEGNKMIVFAKNDHKIGEFIDVRVEEVTPNTLIGSVV